MQSANTIWVYYDILSMLCPLEADALRWRVLGACLGGAGQCQNASKVVANRTSPRLCLEQLEIRGDDGAGQVPNKPMNLDFLH